MESSNYFYYCTIEDFVLRTALKCYEEETFYCIKKNRHFLCQNIHTRNDFCHVTAAKMFRQNTGLVSIVINIVRTTRIRSKRCLLLYSEYQIWIGLRGTLSLLMTVKCIVSDFGKQTTVKGHYMRYANDCYEILTRYFNIELYTRTVSMRILLCN